MGNEPPQVQAAPETPEARRLTELQAQRQEFLNPLEQASLERLTPLQTELGALQTQQQIGLQPQEAALRQQELATAGQRQTIGSNLLGGQLPPGFESLGQATSPVQLTGQPFDQVLEAARGTLGETEARRNEQLLAQQNVAGTLGSGGTHELLRRSGEETDRQLADLTTQFALDETNRLNQQALLGREDELSLLGRQAGILNTGLGIGALGAAPVASSISALGGVQSGLQGSSQAIRGLNAQQQQAQQFAQQLAFDQQAGQNAFFGDIFGGLLGAGATLGAGALISSREYKDNISDNSIDSIAVLKEIDVVEFDYKDEIKDDKHHIGMIAEDTPEILTRNDGKALDAMNIIGVLVDVNKKLIDRVEALEGGIV